jgi:cytochrome c oxidase subunit 2
MDREELILTVSVILVLILIPTAAIYIKYNGKTLPIGPWKEKQEGTVIVYAWTQEDGGWMPNEIIVKKGETVTFVIRSMDMAHGLIIPELNVDSGVVKPGSEKSIQVTFEKPGIYVFYCSVYCSPLHYKMTGKIIVVEG